MKNNRAAPVQLLLGTQGVLRAPGGLAQAGQGEHSHSFLQWGGEPAWNELCPRSRADSHINVSWQPFLSSDLSQISHSHSAPWHCQELFALLDGSTEPEVKENQGHTMGEVLEQEAAQQTPGEMSQESLQTGSVVRNDSSRCDPIMAHWVTCKAGLHSHTPFPASLLS